MHSSMPTAPAAAASPSMRAATAMANLRVGFAAANSHAIVAIDDCPILDPGLHGALDAARALAEALKPTSKPLDIQITAADNGLDVDVRGSGPLPRAMIATLSRVGRTASPGAADAPWRTGADAHAADDRDRRRTRSSCRRARSCRPPSPARKRWRRWSSRHCKRAKHIADLFCGVGPFALRLAAKSRVSAFDSDAGAVTALQKAAASTSGLKPVKAEARDLFRRPLMPQELRDYDAVVFDPPRQGAQAQAQPARGQQDCRRGRGVLQRRDICARRADPDRRRLQDRRRDAGRPVPPHPACRTGGAVYADNVEPSSAAGRHIRK